MRFCVLAFWAALSLSLPGCDDEPTGPQPPVPIKPTGVPSTQGPRPGPPPATKPQERPRNPWSQARVGDALEYKYSHTSRRGQGFETSLHATITLEVVAIDSPWVWVKVTVKQPQGTPSERAFLIPVDREHEPKPSPLAAKPAGKPSKASVGNASFACEESSIDGRASDGPVATWCDSTEPPMYLGRTIWRKSSAAGPSSSADSKLEATRAQRGPEGTTATSPPTGPPRLFAPSLWYRLLPLSTLPIASGQEVQEYFVGDWGVRKWRSLDRLQRTRKDLERTDLVRVADTWYAPSEWMEEPTHTLLETVLHVIHVDARRAWRTGDRVKEGRIQLPAGQVETQVLSFGTTRSEYAKDPWAPLFDGLPWKVRSDPLVEAHGREDNEQGQLGLRLWDWGTTPLAPVPQPQGEPPDVLSQEELQAPVLAKVRDSACVQPLKQARKKGRGAFPYLLSLTLQLQPDGRVSSVALSDPHPPKKKQEAIPLKVIRCLEKELQRLRFPQHGQRMPPFEMELVV